MNLGQGYIVTTLSTSWESSLQLSLSCQKQEPVLKEQKRNATPDDNNDSEMSRCYTCNKKFKIDEDGKEIAVLRTNGHLRPTGLCFICDNCDKLYPEDIHRFITYADAWENKRPMTRSEKSNPNSKVGKYGNP
jgi:uncharacterized protein with PIN domain